MANALSGERYLVQALLSLIAPQVIIIIMAATVETGVGMVETGVGMVETMVETTETAETGVEMEVTKLVQRMEESHCASSVNGWLCKYRSLDFILVGLT